MTTKTADTIHPQHSGGGRAAWGVPRPVAHVHVRAAQDAAQAHATQAQRAAQARAGGLSDVASGARLRLLGVVVSSASSASVS